MMEVHEIKAWLEKLGDDTMVGIDEGGLTLCEPRSGAYIEIGGIPEEILPPNSLISYRGGGYSGCIWEWNYAYIDKDGEFHDIYSSGRMGCKTREELENLNAEEIDAWERGEGDRDKFDIYELADYEECNRLVRELPISHLLCIARWFVQENIDVPLTLCCDRCEQAVAASTCRGIGAHGIGGIRSEFSELICSKCYSRDGDADVIETDVQQ